MRLPFSTLGFPSTRDEKTDSCILRRHSAEELEAMDEDDDVEKQPPPMPKLDHRIVNGA